jgi:hypothetical protein
MNENGGADKKKRGRKPKNTTEITPLESTAAAVEKKKRGRKPKFVYSANDNANIQSNSISDDENIIVKLNVSDNLSKSDEESVKFDDEHPYAYNRDEYMNLSFENSITTVVQPMPTLIEENNRVVNLLKDFEEKNKVKEWPSNTSICCYWCCHKFDNAPYGIPINYTADDSFDVFGCFCSLECGAAYNFKMQDNVDEMWERYNLINLLYRRLNLGTVIKPAPDRLSLKSFGGYLEIHEFREFFKSNKLVTINFPPMSSLTQQIEEINEYELNSDYKYIPIDHDRIDKYKAKMFKRNKPIINSKNSLESSMNLKYNN